MLSPIIPFARAGSDPKAGAKAAALARLIAAGLPVPEGFVISADCYRAHLWASGAREMAARPGEAEERVRIRASILSSSMPDDVRQAIITAYRSLCEQCGDPALRVAVRASGVEGGPDLADFPGAYETYLNVCGEEALEQAVKRVWASLWGGKAAAYRARHELTSEPAMAVVVQRMLSAERAGAAATANPVTGDPRRVLVSCGDVSPDAQPVHHEIDLTSGTWTSGSVDAQLASLVAEKAIQVDETLGGPLEIEWATERGVLWLLQVREIAGLPPFFPVDLPDEPAGREWRRVSMLPAPAFAQSLLRSRSNVRHDDWRTTTEALNGYVYVREPSPVEPEGVRNAERLRSRQVTAGLRMLDDWRRAAPSLSTRAHKLVRLQAVPLDHPRLAESLRKAADVACEALSWLHHLTYPRAHFPVLLREFLSSINGIASDDMHRALIAGGPSPKLERDFRIHDLAIRFDAAEARGSLEEDGWWPGFRQEAIELAREYGYAFRCESELYDISSWSGWLEDDEAILRTVADALPRDSAPTMLTRHAAARSAAREAESVMLDLLKGRARRRFEELLRLSQGFMAALEEAEIIYALACSGIRLLLSEFAGRLVATGVLCRHDDIFHLDLDELTSLSPKPSRADCARLSHAVADRKHALWLQRRLVAPDTLIQAP